MRGRLFGFKGVLFGAISMANAGQPLTLTNGQLDNITRALSPLADTINSGETPHVEVETSTIAAARY
jgi:hypothetical protein